MESTSRITYQKVNDILDAREAVLEAVEEEKNFQRPDQLIDAIFSQPFTKIKHLTDADIYAENTASNYLNELAEIDVVEQREIRGKHYYLNLELERILAH